MTGPDDETQEPVFKDRRRIDPETGEVRQPASDPTAAEGSAATAAPSGSRPAANGAGGSVDLSAEDAALLDGEAERLNEERESLKTEAAKHLDDLQRLRAEFVNYRNRIERDRANDRDATVGSVITALLPALDDLDLAEQHGDLKGSPLEIVAQKLRGSVQALGLEVLGEVGETFDISQHEAIAQLPKPGAEEMTVADVVQRGYRIGNRLLRPAKVAVFVPADDSAPAADASAS